MAGNVKNKRKNFGYFDYSLLFILIFLLGFGLVMIYSTSSYSASLNFDGDGLFYFKRQLFAVIFGLIVMLGVSFIPFQLYKAVSAFVYGFSLATVFLILTPLGYSANGAKRWIRVAGQSIQPAEIVKIGVILFTSFLIFYFKDISAKDKNTFKYAAIILCPGFIGALLIFLITNNLSSAIIIAGISIVLLLISTPRCVKAYIVLGILAVLVAAVVFYMYFKVSHSTNVGSLNFRFERVLAWFNPEQYADGKGFQTLQALYGIGSGGMFGKGLGKSMQKLGFLPEAYNDMIFSVICEELGFFGGLSVILMFAFLLYRIYFISKYTKSLFGNQLLCGIFAHIAIQVVLNIAVVTNTIPNTGISLPFISFGGTSVLFLLIEMGIVLNIARYVDFNEG